MKRPVVFALLVLVGVIKGEQLQKQSDDRVGGGIRGGLGSASVSSATQHAVPEPWAHEGSDIPPDPAVRFGSLANGMRYIIMPNSQPPGALSLHLRVNAGSLKEKDDQLGLAHFLEHMMFNGLRSYSADQLIPIMQSMGIAFGSHVNAYTSFDETVYSLHLPNTENSTLDLGFTVMRDWADGALLQQEEIDKERGVILSEMNVRDSVSSRLTKMQYEFLLPGNLLNDRFPIGTAEVIQNAPRDAFVDFYEQHYVPEGLTVVAVGDLEADVLESLIYDYFFNMTTVNHTVPNPDLGPVLTGAGFRTAVFADEAVSVDSLYVATLRPITVAPDTRASRLAAIPLQVANKIVNRRFQNLVKKENSTIRSGGTGRSVWFREIEYGSMSVTPVDDKWREAVAVIEQELRRVVEHGFTESELKEAIARKLNELETDVEMAPSRWSPWLASLLSISVNSHTVFSSPEEDLAIWEEGLANITTKDLHNAFVEFWNTTDLNLILTTKVADNSTEKEMLDLWTASALVNVTAPEEFEDVTFNYTDFGTPGTVVSEVVQQDLGIRQLVLSNKVRVNLKETDFTEKSIMIMGLFGTGKVGMPKNMTELDSFTGSVMNGGGLGMHDNEELDRMFAGKTVGASIYSSDNTFGIWGVTTPDHLELQLQLMAAYLTDPGYRDEGARQFRKAIPNWMNSLEYTLGGPIAKMDEWLHGGDGRFVVPTQEELEALKVSDARDWIHPQLTQSYLEVSIIGDYDPPTIGSSVVDLVLKTFGALPDRADAIDTTNIDRSVGDFPDTPGENIFTYKSELAQASANVIWNIPPFTGNISESRRLSVLATILQDRMRNTLREELGVTYGPYAASRPSSTFDYGVLTGVTSCTPEDSAVISNLTIAIAEKLATEGVTEQELKQAIEPTVANHKTSLRSNNFWIQSIMSQSQSHPETLDFARSYDADYASITVQEINSLAAQYLFRNNSLRVQLLPVNGTESRANDIKGAPSLAGSFSGPSVDELDRITPNVFAPKPGPL